MKKYLTIVLLLTVLFLPMNFIFAQNPGDNDNLIDPWNDNDNNNLNNNNNDNLNNGNNNNNNGTNNNPNNNNGLNNNNRPNNNNVIDDDLDDGSDIVNYVVVGISGIALGSLVTYFIVRKDY